VSPPTSQDGIAIVPSAPRSITPPQPSNRPLQFGVFFDPTAIQNHHRPGSPHPSSRSPPSSPILSLSSPQPPRGYDPTGQNSRIPSFSSKRTSSFSSPLARPSDSDGATTPTSEPINISRPSTPRDHHGHSGHYSHRPAKSYAGLDGASLGFGISRTRSRRMSSVGTITSELFGSFVGSYEESILNGRMSTTPSKPVPFIAQIGVLSLHPSTPVRLRCPPHLTVPFPAVFYSVQDYDSPSPYVGQLDIAAAVAEKRVSSPGSKLAKPSPVEGYRIPQKGQLQIIIKNPNKTAIKLFLIPYDLEDMPPRTKTFLRQKSYADDILRYAVHIQICSPCRDKYFIFGSIRVVFANRVPDGNERLRVENLHPDQLLGGDTLSGGRFSKWESQAAYAARMRRQSGGLGQDRLEWNGESLEREVMMSASSSAQQRGREKNRRSRGDRAELKEGRVFTTPQIRRITPMTLGDTLVSGTKSPVPRRGEAVEQGLLAMKLRELKVEGRMKDEV
jgi:hypothetical protein